MVSKVSMQTAKKGWKLLWSMLAYVITTTVRDESAGSSRTAVVEGTPTTSNQRRCVGECAKNENVSSNKVTVKN